MIVTIAHRGSSADHTENTLSAVKLAINQKADMIEGDIRFTKDNIPILFHDRTLKRLSGKRVRIKGLTLRKIKNISLKKQEKVVSLEEFLARAKGNIDVILDIKVAGREKKIISIIEKKSMVNMVIISSRHIKILRRIKKINPKIKTALIFRFRKKAIIIAKKLHCYSVHPHHLRTTRRIVKLAKVNGLKVYPFTVNRRKRMKQLIIIGVNGIMTDKPAVLQNLVHKT